MALPVAVSSRRTVMTSDPHSRYSTRKGAGRLHARAASPLYSARGVGNDPPVPCRHPERPVESVLEPGEPDPLAAAEQPPRNLSEPVAREPGPRRGETERPRSTVAFPPDHPVRAPSGVNRAVIGIPPGQFDRHALAQRRRDPRRHHPCESRPACSRPASTCRRRQRSRRLSASGHDRGQHCKAPHRHFLIAPRRMPVWPPTAVHRGPVFQAACSCLFCQRGRSRKQIVA